MLDNLVPEISQAFLDRIFHVVRAAELPLVNLSATAGAGPSRFGCQG